MHYLWAYLTGGHVLQEGMHYRTCVRGGYSYCLSVQQMYVPVAFHLTSFCFSSLALDAFFFGLEMFFFFLAFVIIRSEPLNPV